MTFTVTYREKTGAKAEVEIEASNRAECVAACKRRGIAPMGIREGRASSRPRAAETAAPHDGGAKRSGGALWRAAILAATCLVGGIGAWWWLGREEAQPSRPTKQTVAKQKPTAATKNTDVSDSKQAAAGADAKDAKKNPTAKPQVEGRVAGAPELPAIPAVTTNTPSIPPLPPQTFSNASDQVLAMIASADASGDMPPLPISRDIEAEFLKSLKQEIVILDTDDEKTRELKLAVKETREQLKQLIASGKTVAEVLAEHQQLASENAKVRNDAMKELKQLVESGDIEGAKEYKRKINVALQQMGIAELSIPVTDEERAERAAARRERMLKKRAAQAAEAEKLKKENLK